MDAKMVFKDEFNVYEWHGGEYIEVGSIFATPEETVPRFHSYDVINVWDYEKSGPYIPRTLEAFQERCEAHSREALNV
jgi:hypothetical protein